MSDARIRAVRFANEHLNKRPELVWLGEEFRVEVTDEEGHLFFSSWRSALMHRRMKGDCVSKPAAIVQFSN